jgi:hypothetical protein
MTVPGRLALVGVLASAATAPLLALHSPALAKKADPVVISMKVREESFEDHMRHLRAESDDTRLLLQELIRLEKVHPSPRAIPAEQGQSLVAVTHKEVK